MLPEILVTIQIPKTIFGMLTFKKGKTTSSRKLLQHCFLSGNITSDHTPISDVTAGASPLTVDREHQKSFSDFCDFNF